MALTEDPTQRESGPGGSLEAEIAAEQAAVDLAYERLVHMRESALDVVRHHRELGQTTTGQARVEWESLLALTDQRLHHLELGGASLCFGRLDLADGETYQVGRLSILDRAGDPLVIDWRAPAAEAFYRATGRNPMGLVRRRHLLTKGRRVVGLDDEVFDIERAAQTDLSIVGEGALLAALERSRTGRMGDIVATIQAEQDVIIRAPFPGILIVSGGPGTGKTAVALHRAAYLLYTNRQRLEEAGVLVIGPNRTFLRYIEHVLPSLGESGVELATIDGLYRSPLVGGRPAGTDSAFAERVKGDARMVDVLRKAVRDRQRPLAADLVVPYGSRNLRVPRAELARIVDGVRQRSGPHNARRPTLAARVRRALWRQHRRVLEQRLTTLPRELPVEANDPLDQLDPLDIAQATALTLEREEQQFMANIGSVAEVRAALERMWPVLSPEELLHDLFGAPSLLRLATAGLLSDAERDALARPRQATAAQVAWTSADLALLDEAQVLLGPPPSRARRRRRAGRVRDDARWMIEDTIDDIALQTGELDTTMRRTLIERLTDRELSHAAVDDDDDGSPPAFGHVIVDEAQDLSPMQWRMVARRNPSGSMTIVGDLGQSSRPGAVADWAAALAQLPSRRPPRTANLTINYRTPAEIMEIAASVLQVTDPTIEPPQSVRTSGALPRFTHVRADQLHTEVIDQAARLRSELGEGKVAVITAPDRRDALAAALAARPDLDFREGSDALEAAVGLFTPTQSKGLEFDAVVLVEPQELAGTSHGSLRGLYVALTRATRFLAVVHAGELPVPLQTR